MGRCFQCPIAGFFLPHRGTVKGAPPSGDAAGAVTTFWATLSDRPCWPGRTGTDGASGWNPGGSLELERQCLPFIQVLPIDLVVLFGFGGLVPSPPRAYCRLRGGACNGYAANGRCTGGGMAMHRRADGLASTRCCRLIHQPRRHPQVVVEGDVDISPCPGDLCGAVLQPPSGAPRRYPRRTVRRRATLGGALAWAPPV